MSFDYKVFAKDLTKQAEEVLPEDIAQEHKKEFLNRIHDFTYIAGEAFSKDKNIKSSDAAKMFTQVISEWTFHKYIDLLRSEIPQMYHESILQKLAFVAFEMIKESDKGNLSQGEMLKLVEIQLQKAYEKSCKHLLDNGQITQAIYDRALNLSNVESMPKNPVHNIKVVKNKSTFKYTVLFMIFGLFTISLNTFLPNWTYLKLFDTAALIVLSMYLGFYVGVKKRF